MRKRHQPGCPCCGGATVPCGACNVAQTLTLTTPFGVVTLTHNALYGNWHGCVPWTTTGATDPPTAHCNVSSDPVLTTVTTAVAFSVGCDTTIGGRPWRLRAHAKSLRLAQGGTANTYWTLPIAGTCSDTPIGETTTIQSDCRPGGGACADYFWAIRSWYGVTDNFSTNPAVSLGLGTSVVRCDAGGTCAPIFGRWTNLAFSRGQSHAGLFACPFPAAAGTVYNPGTLFATWTLSP